MSRAGKIAEGTFRRMARATVGFENGGRNMPPIRFRQPGGDGDPVRLGKTTAAWAKGTLADIELYEEGTPGDETAKSPTPEILEDCVNKFADIGADKWVIVARGGNGAWYLISAECASDDPPA